MVNQIVILKWIGYNLTTSEHWRVSYMSDQSNLGDQIKSIVEEAVDTMNFSKLNRDISSTVNSAIHDLRDAFGINNNQDRNRSNQNGSNQKFYQDTSSYQHRNPDTSGYKEAGYQRNQRFDYRTKPTPFDIVTINPRPSGSVSGVVLSGLGIFGSIVLGIAILVCGILGVTLSGTIFFSICVGLSPLFLGSLYMGIKGNHITKRIKRFRFYASRLKGRSYCPIKELANNIGKSDKFVVKDLQKMIALRMFPEGHIDESGTCFILNNETFKQYEAAQESLRQREIEEALQKETKENKTSTSSEKDQKQKKVYASPELEKAITEGKNYIECIQAANQALPGEEITNKLNQLEAITTKIFECVEQHPSQLPEIRKFMEYYLPTTLKLVHAYQEFEAQPVQGDNISTAKGEIMKTLDTINGAFVNLLDSLYEEAAMEVSADISVLETLFAQEGLTGSDFKN